MNDFAALDDCASFRRTDMLLFKRVAGEMAPVSAVHV